MLSSSLARLAFTLFAVTWGAGARRQPPELLVAAAADLASLQNELCNAFQQATGIPVRFTLASSGILARQIAQGAPFDVYLSANQGFVDDLVAGKHLAGESVRVYALGRVGLWSRTGRYRSLTDLVREELRHLAMPNPVHAPYGLAARQALEKQGIWKDLQPRIVYGENVRQALQYAESGNADAVLTAWSLVFNRGGVLIPDTLHAPVRQACGVVSSTRHRAEAQNFVDFLCGPKGQAVLKSHGLFPAPVRQSTVKRKT